jgi:hypothetical protein
MVVVGAIMVLEVIIDNSNKYGPRRLAVWVEKTLEVIRVVINGSDGRSGGYSS